MKTLNLKRMNWIMALAMMLGVMFVSCSDDNDNGGVDTPVFPALQEMNCAAGESIELSFDANMDWQLSSNAAWCKFVNGEFTETLTSGKAGDGQKVQVAVSADGQNYDEDAVAEITMTMGEKSQVVFKITRAKKEYVDLTVTNEDGTITYGESQPLTIKGSGLRDIPSDSIFTVVYANADMTVGIESESVPAWLKVFNDGNGRFRLIFDKTKGVSNLNSFGTEKGEKIVFATEDALGGNAQTTDKVRRVEIPLAYEGLKMESISLTPVGNSGTGVGLSVNADGTEFFLETSDGLSGETSREEYGSELKTAVSVRNTDYHVLVVGQTKATAPNMAEYYTYDVEQNMDWVHLSESGDEISLTVDPLGEEAARGALVMVFSEDFWTSIETDSIAKYGDLKTALFGQEVVASLDNGEQIMGDIVKFEYSDNVWTSFDQAKEGEASEDQLILGGYYYSYVDDGGEFNPENEMWMTFADVNGMGMEGVNVSITDITGTAEADAALNDMGISGIPVYKVSYPESLATTADNALVVEVQSGMEATDNIGSAWVDGVNAETLTHEGKPCVKIYGTNASAATACHLAVGNLDMGQFKAYIIVEFYK